jgi:hypothetical protein
MRSLLAVAMVATPLLLATFHVTTRGASRHCPPPSGQSIEKLFAPCLAREELETTGWR